MASTKTNCAYLLDANALIALCWPHHEHHARMQTWFAANAKRGWATCDLTQAALVRVSLQPAFTGAQSVNDHVKTSDLHELLLRNTAHPQHHFLPLSIGFDVVMRTCTAGIWGHRQITDAWLLTTAVTHGCKLLTFDQGIGALLATQQERERSIALLTD